jgi:hypothetical protein
MTLTGQTRETPSGAGGTGARTDDAAVGKRPLIDPAPAAPQVAAGGAPAAVTKPATYKDGAALEAMTLTQLDAYAREQADWATGPAVGARKDALWGLLQKARADEAFLAGCGPMKVAGLLGAMADAKKLGALEHYCAAVHKDRATVEIEPIADTAEAIAMGETLPKLEATPGGVAIKTIMKQQAGNTQLQDMIADHAVEPFIKYVQTSHPVLQANNGAEITSYLAMHTEGVDPAGYKTKVPRIRNLHRFEKAALDALAAHETDTSKKKPLTLILHSAMDHNGAFHRDPNITAVAKHPKNVTIMLEGKETLGDVQAELDPIAKKYGQGDKVDQVMFAGHGAARIIELAGTVKEDKVKGKLQSSTDDVDLDGNQAATDALFAELMKHMDPASPNHRVIFNACLTNSNAVQGPLDADPATAQAQIKAAIAKDGSLATTFREKAKAMGMNIDSRGANASIGEIGLINKTTGALDLVSKDDPMVTADKIKYVEFGKEPEGVMRAVLEEWGNDKKKCLEAVARRQKAGAPGDWAGRFIHAMLDIVVGKPDDANLINAFADGASAIAEAVFEDECRVARVKGAIPAAHRARILGELARTAEWKDASYKHLPLVFNQVWAQLDATKALAFRDTLGAAFNCHSAAKFVDIDFLVGAGLLDGLLPVPPPASPPAGQLILALIDVAQQRDKARPRSIKYLQTLLGSERWFPPALGVAAKLSGLATENEILVAIDRAKPSSKTPDANVDVDRDGKNDTYVEPLTRTAKIDVPTAAFYEKPDTSSKKVGSLPKGSDVRIIGKASPAWFAIELNNRTAFAQVIDIAA